MTFGWLASSPSNASAGGHELHPCEVKSSTTTGRPVECGCAKHLPEKLSAGSARINANTVMRSIDDEFTLHLAVSTQKTVCSPDLLRTPRDDRVASPARMMVEMRR